jgi:hypothetical protein
MTKTIIWYEFTDQADVKNLRDAADALERDGYVKLLLPNVELDEPPAFSNGGAAGGSGIGGWVAGNFQYGAGGGSADGSSNFTLTVGSNGVCEGWLTQQAKALNKPVACGGGSGGGQPAYRIWVFPDGHTESLPLDETPRWPKDDPLRDAVEANR